MTLAARIFISPSPSETLDATILAEQLKQATRKSSAEISFEVIVSSKEAADKFNQTKQSDIRLKAVTEIKSDVDAEHVLFIVPEHLKFFANILNLVLAGKKNSGENALFAMCAEEKSSVARVTKKIFHSYSLEGKASGVFFMNASVASTLLPVLNPARIHHPTELLYKAYYKNIPIQEVKQSLSYSKSLGKIFINSMQARFDWYFKGPIREIKQTGISFKALLSEPNHAAYRLLFFLLCAAVLILFPIFSFDFGITMDEPEDTGYFQKVFQYFLTFGEDKSCLDVNYRVNSHLVNYGPFVNLLCVAVQEYISPFGVYETRHLIISLFGVIGVVYTGLAAKRLGNWSLAVVAVLFLVLTPLYFGHSMNNQKDLPFAAFYMISIYFILRFINEMPKPRLRTWFFMSLAIGITLSIRIGGLLVLAYAGLFAFLSVLYLMKQEGFGKHVKTGFTILYKLMIVGTIAYIIGIIFWPYALEAPIDNPMAALKSFESFSMVHIWELFEGQRYYMKEFPWYYLPKSILITVPLHVLAGFILIFPLVFVIWKKMSRAAFGILLFAVLFPILYILYKDSVLYSSWRHALFVYPPMIVLSAAGWQALSSLLKNNIAKTIVIGIVFVMTGKVLLWMVKNHPYEYVYYNETVGGLAGAYSNYETDYWCQSPRAAIEWMAANGHLSKTKLVKIASNNVSASVANYIPEEFRDSTQVSWTRESEWGKNQWDYAIFTTRTLTPTQLRNGSFPPKGTIHVIEADGIPLAAIVKSENSYLYDGFQLINQNKFIEADSVLRKAVEYAPMNEEAYRTLALAQLNMGDTTNTRINLNKAIELMPENSYAHTFFAFYYMRANDSEMAKTVLNKAIHFRINNSLAHETLGDIYANAKEHVNALKHYEDALGYSGNQEGLYDKMGRINFARYNENPSIGNKYLEEALKYFGNAMQKSPNNPSNYYNVSIVLDKMGRKDQAKQYYDKFKELSGK